MTLEEMRRKKAEGLVVRRQLLDKAGIARALRSVAQKILEHHAERDKLVLLGIRTGGVHLAKRLRDLIRAQIKIDIPLGAMDITLYRDDVFKGLPRPEVGPTEIPGSIHGKAVILVDDVLYTGRTIRAALEELMEFGRPERVELAVLVDRGHRELPIQADYVGLNVVTGRDESIRVLLHELGETDEVVLCERSRP
jgi:pyrimidine operon attenuation protein/uracil phosphoribosyltransferase